MLAAGGGSGVLRPTLSQAPPAGACCLLGASCCGEAPPYPALPAFTSVVSAGCTGPGPAAPGDLELGC